MKNKSRADYFKERRKNYKQFNVAIERKKMELFEDKLKKRGQTKVDWLNDRIDEEIKE